MVSLKRKLIFIFSIIFVLSTYGLQHSIPKTYAAVNIYVKTTAEIQSAMLNAQPGHNIMIAPGTYELPNNRYYSNANGTSSNPITITSQDPSKPAVLKGGNLSTGGYTFYITGDYWVIKDLKITYGQKGIVLDNSNNTHINRVTVSYVGQEGIHVRDGSSNVTIENSIVEHTGATGDPKDMGYGEGIYVGSDRSVWKVNKGNSGYDRNVDNTIIKNNIIGPNVTAELIDIKEGTSGTLVSNNTFLGSGISGHNYADTFIDVKGVNVIILDNVGYGGNNPNIKAEFAEVNRTSSNPWVPSNETANGSLTNTADGNYYINNVYIP
ncbi:right-handed parallel beta-helix repeat-containing protein [Chengkuizengella sp. SCS-71B]|uniref:right-handed parallel beta-helix repeat-containing protein n=1 Tax=Chengkuizengella sp. SCS-71B TaxID=3115290 RepID=UPI0032C21D6C